MRNIFQNLGYRFRQWMQGRYGMDELSRFLSFAGLALMMLSLFNKLRFLYLPALVLLLWSVFRTYSRNIEKRGKERKKYLEVRSKITGFFSLQKRKWQDRKTYRYFKCPGCSKTLRVPTGKGTVRVRCPECGMEIIKKT